MFAFFPEKACEGEFFGRRSTHRDRNGAHRQGETGGSRPTHPPGSRTPWPCLDGLPAFSGEKCAYG